MQDENIVLPPKRLKQLFVWLVRLAESRGISHEVAEELTNDTLLVAIERYDPVRGTLEAFCWRVLMNKIKNYVRPHAPVNQLPIDKFLEVLVDHNIAEEEGNGMQAELFISRLLERLDTGERNFLMKWMETLDELENRAVSETARRLGLSESEGTAIAKRIKRSARNLMKEITTQMHFDLAVLPSLAVRDYVETIDRAVCGRRIPTPDDDLPSLSFDRFWSNLTNAQKERLASFV